MNIPFLVKTGEFLAIHLSTVFLLTVKYSAHAALVLKQKDIEFSGFVTKIYESNTCFNLNSRLSDGYVGCSTNSTIDSSVSTE